MGDADFVRTPWRFWARVSRTDGCWEWQGTRSRVGYGVIQHQGKQWKAHRLALLLTNGSLDDAKWVCHHCDNPRCVRPDHLYEGTATDNNRDTVKRARRAPLKTHCKRGHEFTPENTWKTYRGNRRCAICTNALNLESYHRNKTEWKAYREHTRTIGRPRKSA